MGNHRFATCLLFCIFISGCAQIRNNDAEKHFFDRLQPVTPGSGFRMAGYWVWGGSVIKVGDEYHLFASRWPKKNKFPDDYFVESEIVHATSRSFEGPYTFQKVVIGERDGSYWDSNMAHNPTIHKIGNEFVLFYIGSDFTTLRPGSNRLLRRIGYATATDIEGPWTRSEQAVIHEESNNPAILVEPNGEVKLMYRDEELRVKLAQAENYKGPYLVVNDDIWNQGRLEDFYLFKADNKYHFICEDNEGVATGHVRWGAHFISEDGQTNWQPFDPVVAYDHTIPMTDGSVLQCVRRERAQLLIENGKITGLLNGVYDGENSWCQPVALKP